MTAKTSVQNLNSLSATEIAQAIRSQTLTVTETLTFFLDIIEKREANVKAWAFLDRSAVLKRAGELDRQIKSRKPLGKLFGLPIGVKDIFNTIDMPTCMGSPIWKDFTPGNDCRAVFNLRQADGIILGKTATAEFAVHEPCDTANPHNLEYSPGTSSSGSAAAIAAGMVPLALGTQTAGSIIRPASYCGVYGFKPSFGLIPRTGTLKTTDSLDTIGFFGRSVDDLQLLLETLMVKGPNFPLNHKHMNDAIMQNKKGGRWKVAFAKSPKWNQAADHAQKAVLQFVSNLADSGEIEVEELELPEDFTQAHRIHETIYCKTLAYYFKEEYKQNKLISGVLNEMIEKGQGMSLDDYKKALEEQKELALRFEGLFGSFDTLLTLSTGSEAPKKYASETREDSCLIWTLCGAPAMNLPVFTSPDGLPFGAQIVSNRYSDFRLLKFAKWLENGNWISKVAIA